MTALKSTQIVGDTIHYTNALGESGYFTFTSEEVCKYIVKDLIRIQAKIGKCGTERELVNRIFKLEDECMELTGQQLISVFAFNTTY